MFLAFFELTSDSTIAGNYELILDTTKVSLVVKIDLVVWINPKLLNFNKHIDFGTQLATT